MTCIYWKWFYNIHVYIYIVLFYENLPIMNIVEMITYIAI
jgi:hypothetical protein